VAWTDVTGAEVAVAEVTGKGNNNLATSLTTFFHCSGRTVHCTILLRELTFISQNISFILQKKNYTNKTFKRYIKPKYSAHEYNLHVYVYVH